MKLCGMTVDAFTGLLGSDAPAPGGGSTAALNGALGAALTGMAAALTASREKYAHLRAPMTEVMKAVDALRCRLLDVLERDTEAFEGVSAVFAMPRDTDEQKAARAAAMQSALKACTETPFEMMACSLEALRLAEKVVPDFNQTSASDLGVGILNLKAAMQGAWLNILINIPGIKNEAFVRRYRDGGAALLAEGLPLADRLYEQVLAVIEG